MCLGNRIPNIEARKTYTMKFLSSSPDPQFNLHLTESDPYQWYRVSVCIGSVSIRRIYQQLLRVGKILKQNFKKSNNLLDIFINFRKISNFLKITVTVFRKRMFRSLLLILLRLFIVLWKRKKMEFLSMVMVGSTSSCSKEIEEKEEPGQTLRFFYT